MSTPRITKEQLVRLKTLRQQTLSGEAKRIREEARVTQAELGAALGVPPATISFWENGRRIPSGPFAMRYAELLDSLQEKEAV